MGGQREYGVRGSLTIITAQAGGVREELISACARSGSPTYVQFPFWLYVPIVSVGVLYLIFVVWTNEMSKT